MQLSLSKTFISLLLVGLAVFAAGNALANVAANTQIINQATLSYDDGSGTRTSTTRVTVTVSLVPAVPIIIPGPDQTTTYNGSGTTLQNSFIVRASANGPDNYNLSTSITGSTNTGAPNAATATITSGATITLGATVTLTGSTDTILVVPADGTANNPTGIVNGIQGGDTVYINGETRQVSSVADNATGTSTITLAAALNNGAPTAGSLVLEQKTVTVNVTAGTITATGTDVTVDKNLTATSTTDNTKTVSSDSITDTYTSGSANLTKYVRNITVASGTGTPYTYNSINYYQTGVQGAPGNTLEYILVATNTGGAAVNSAMIEDVLPTEFVTLKSNAYGAGKEATYVDEGGTPSTLSAAADLDTATYDGGTKTLTVYVGSGATNAAGGAIPGGNTSVHVLYQVTINP